MDRIPEKAEAIVAEAGFGGNGMLEFADCSGGRKDEGAKLVGRKRDCEETCHLNFLCAYRRDGVSALKK
jgi:hypothetical protein